MSRPVIGITTDSNDANDRYLASMPYIAAVERAGGLPLLIPFGVDHALIPQYVDLLDGMLFTGGDDMNPARYGEEWHPNVNRMHEARELFEFALIAEVERRRMPTLGICFGSQLMNVHRGGSLTQFLPDIAKENSLEHRRMPDRPPARHPVKFDTSSGLGAVVGKSDVSVNTYHKQAAKKIGKGLRVIATAPDGVIEAFEDPTFPLFAAVQWHPERIADEKEHFALFKLLVETAGRNGNHV